MIQNSNPVSWFEIYVQDMDRARKFYEAVLRAPMYDLTDPHNPKEKIMAFPMANDAETYYPGASGALVQVAGAPSGGNSTIVYFISENCAVEESRIEPAGGKIIKPKTSLGAYGYMVLAQDTEGNMIGFHSKD